MAHKLFVASAVALLGGCLSSKGDASAKLEHWDALLAKELHAGSSKAAVEAFFSRHNLESSYSPSERTIVAIDRHVETGGMVTTDIIFHCPLNPDQQLVSCKASFVHTGP